MIEMEIYPGVFLGESQTQTDEPAVFVRGERDGHWGTISLTRSAILGYLLADFPADKLDTIWQLELGGLREAGREAGLAQDVIDALDAKLAPCLSDLIEAGQRRWLTARTWL